MTAMGVRHGSRRFATRLRLEWSLELHVKATAAGIEVFRAWPPAWATWPLEWGRGNAFIGNPDDPAQVVLELSARSPVEAESTVMRALGVSADEFIVRPTECAETSGENDLRPLVLDPVSGVLTR
jgi:hypothetical protein